MSNLSTTVKNADNLTTPLSFVQKDQEIWVSEIRDFLFRIWNGDNIQELKFMHDFLNSLDKTEDQKEINWLFGLVFDITHLKHFSHQDIKTCPVRFYCIFVAKETISYDLWQKIVETEINLTRNPIPECSVNYLSNMTLRRFFQEYLGEEESKKQRIV